MWWPAIRRLSISDNSFLSPKLEKPFPLPFDFPLYTASVQTMEKKGIYDCFSNFTGSQRNVWRKEEAFLQDGLQHGHPTSPQHKIFGRGPLFQHDAAASGNPEKHRHQKGKKTKRNFMSDKKARWKETVWNKWREKETARRLSFSAEPSKHHLKTLWQLGTLPVLAFIYLPCIPA